MTLSFVKYQRVCVLETSLSTGFMMRFFFLLFTVLSLCSSFLLGLEEHAPKQKILVTIAPYRFFVKEIGGDDFDVEVMVPSGSSAHSFEPSPRQMIEASSARVWFALGESFEPRVIRAMKGMNSSLKVIDLREGVDLIRGEEQCLHHCHPGGLCLAQGFDPHMWLSPKEVKRQIHTITNTLSELKQDHSSQYKERAAFLEKRLDQIEQELSTLLPKNNPVTILVSHPSFGYMARDFGLFQISIEFEGREPTQKQVLSIVAKAKASKVKTIFIQVQHPSKGAKVIAEYLGARLIIVDPYSEDYFSNIKKMADLFSQSRAEL